jgi:transcriptional regulator of acetoin/glycerol metabolism
MRRAWDRFCATGDTVHLERVPAHIAGSWQRSRASGVDPGLRRFPVPVPEPVWTARERELQEACAAALRPFLDDVHDASILLTVSEKAGRTILREGNAAALAAAETIDSVPGALIGEAAIGTNSVGTALFLRDAVHVDFLEHFCEGFQDWADTGVPILHPFTRELVGAVDFAVHRGSLSRVMAAVAKTAARAIEARLLEKELDLRRDLLLDWGRRNRRATEAAVAVDRNGLIVALTDAAKAVLGPDGAGWQGRPVRDFAELAALRDRLDRAEGGEVHLPPGPGRIAGAMMDRVDAGAGYAGGILRLRPAAPVKTQVAVGWSSQFSFDQLIGVSPRFRQAVDLARKVARTNLPVLIQGETGTGKEMVAHAIHAASARADGPFVTVNCGAIPADLISSELFGYEKGAFTGASSTGKRGKFEQAEGGTIFLDEVTETSALLQVSLLRVLQDGVVVPIGAELPRKADVRIIAAVNADFAEAMARGAFRRDLYYRLKGVSIGLPPLRQRREDIPGLIAHFCAGAGRAARIAPEAMHLLTAYGWPGNVRELHSVIRAAALLTEGPEIGVGDLPAEIRVFGGPPDRDAATPSDDGSSFLERERIARAMRDAGGNVVMAARALGIARSTLYRKLGGLGLRRESAWQ